MNKVFSLLSTFILLLPITHIHGEEVNLDEFNDRIPKCCERTTSEGVTQCRYSILSCGGLNEMKGTAASDYKQKNGLCLDSNKTAREQSSDFQNGFCDNTNINNSQIKENIDKVAIYAGYNQNQKNPNAISLFVGRIINIALGLTGLIFLIFTIYSGIQWMTAGGNSDRVSKAKKRLIQSVIGMTITSIAYAAASLIINVIASAS